MISRLTDGAGVGPVPLLPFQAVGGRPKLGEDQEVETGRPIDGSGFVGPRGPSRADQGGRRHQAAQRHDAGRQSIHGEAHSDV